VPAAPRCLLLADGEYGDALATALGPDTVRAPALAPADRAGYAALLAELAAGSGVPQRVVHAWTVRSAAPGTQHQHSGPDSGVDEAVHSIVALGQALAEASLPGPVHLDVVTAGTRAVLGGDVTDPVAAGAAAAAWSLPTELPGVVTVRHVDAASSSDVAAVAAELRVPPSGEYGQTVALRRGRRWAPGFEPVPLPAAADSLPDGGVYLITGGTGGIGGTVAEDLARRCRARIVLLARTPLPPRDQWAALAGGGDRIGRTVAAIRRIEAAGGQVLPVAADVTDATALRVVRERILAEYGRLDGIVHAAGVPGGGLIEVKTREAVEAVLAPKLAGTRALAEVFGDLDLAFVVLCGSVTGVVGGLGQADYAAANAYLDAVAHHGGGFGCPVLSVDWGAWSEVGMAVETARPAALGGTAEAASSAAGAGALAVGSPADADSAAGPAGAVRAVRHPVLTDRVDDGPGSVVRGRLGPASDWVLGEHRIAGVPVLPGTGHLELIRAALAAAVPAPAADAVVELRDVAFVAPLAVPDGAETTVQVRLRPGDDGYDVTVATGAGPHVRGTAAWVRTAAPQPIAVAELRDRLGAGTEVTSHRSRSGLVEFGGRWQNLRAVHRGAGEVLARLVAPPAVAAELADWPLHPALLDEATSLLDVEGGSFLPLGYGRITVHAPLPARLWAHAVGQPGDEVTTADIRLLDDDGRVLVDIADFMLRRVDPAAMASTVQATPASGAPPAGGAAPAPAGALSPGAAAADRGSTPPGGTAGGSGAAGGIAPADGAEVLWRLLSGGLGPQVAVSVRPMDEQLAAAAATIDTLTGPVDPDAGGALGDEAAPGTELEAQLAAIWAEVLGVPAVGRDDDFFDLGGNSLVAVQLIGKVRTATGVKLPMRSLFETTTVAGMAELVEQRRDAATEAPAAAIPRLARPR
ncbi:SDR family NAD(P)-dependent oxidoreductase, partial [Actinocatenispora thailandica]